MANGVLATQNGVAILEEDIDVSGKWKCRSVVFSVKKSKLTFRNSKNRDDLPPK